MYHVTDNEGAVFGPVDAETLGLWIAEERVPRDPLVHGGGSTEWLRMSLHPDFVPRRRIPRTAVIATAALTGVLIVALIVAMIPLARSGRFGLAPDVIAGAFKGERGAIPRPAAPVRSDVKALKAKPMPGVRIDAPRGALDRERTFTGRELDSTELAAAQAALKTQGGLIALGGYDIDAGMQPEDLFREPVIMEFDFEELGIPKELWDQVGIANVDESGTVSLVPGDLKGSTYSIETRHNGVWLTALLIAASTGLVIADQLKIPAGDFSAIYWKPGTLRWRVMYPASWPPADPQAVAQADAEMGRLNTKHGLVDGDKLPVGEHVKRLQALDADPEYQALKEQVQDEKWKLDKFLPVRVKHAIVALDRASDYMDKRGFKRPGVERFGQVTDVFVVDKSLGPESYGLAHNEWTISPFIVLDGTKLPDADAASFTADQKARFDEMQLTAMHELFHVVQAAYVFIERDRNLWFNETTAVVLEQEAKSYYLDEKKYATSWPTTKRFYAAFFDPIEFYDFWNEAPNQSHGYGQSLFFEFLRDHHYSTGGAKEQFLPKLLEDFGSFRGGAIKSLYRTTGGTPESLERAFYQFTYVRAGELQTGHQQITAGRKKLKSKLTEKTPVATLTQKNPVHVMRFAEGGAPISTRILELEIEGASKAAGGPKPGDPVYILSTNGIEQHGAVVRLGIPTASTKTWDEIRGGCVLPTQFQTYIMRAEPYLKTPSAIANAGEIDAQGPIVFGMLQGDAPTVEVKDELVKISWKPSAAAGIKRADGSRALISRYRVTLISPNGRPTVFGADEPRVEIPVAVVDKIVQAEERSKKNQVFKALHGIGQRDLITLMNISEAVGGGDQPKIKVSYQEVAAIPGAPAGPHSKVAEFEYGDEAREFGGVTGVWGGNVPFSEGQMMRLDLIEGGGGDIIGTMHWGETIPVKGSWDSKTRSWSLRGRESNVWMPMFLVFEGRLLKLPGQKLYMVAPPALLSRQSDEVPTLGWQLEPQDMEVENLLEQLRRELEELDSGSEGGSP